eukprot:gene12077-3559_t
MAAPSPQAKVSKEWEQYKANGNSLYGDERYTEAIVAYTRAIQHNNTMSNLFSNRALCHLKLQHWSNVEVDAQAAIEID